MDLHSEPALSSTAIIQLTAVDKRFGTIWANRGINLAINEGEIHALVGENGAGKSTLLRLLFGHLRPDRGTIYLSGQPTVFRRPHDAQRAGIGMVHQQLLIFPQLTTLENIVVGAEPRRGLWLQRTAARSAVKALCRTFGFDLPLDLAARALPYAQHQQIEIVRMLFRGARILLLDEPTSLLAPPEVASLLALLKTLQAQGRTVVFVSHRLEEVYSVANRISVMVAGQLLGTYSVGTTTIDQVAQKILTGDDSTLPSQRLDEVRTADLSQRKPLPVPTSTAPATPVLVLREVCTAPSAHDAALSKVTLTMMAPGEILGISGIVGNGLRTLAHTLAGFAQLTQGHIELEGEDVTRLSPRQRCSKGIRWLPANPLEEALLPNRPLWESLLLGRQRDRHLSANGLLRKRAVMRWGIELLRRHAVRYERVTQPLNTLSGGNQQKLALAAVFANSSRLVILEQPSRGLDLRAQRRLHQMICSMSGEGVIFVVISHELDELLGLCHRIGILYRGGLAGMVDCAQAHRHDLGRWMLGLE